MTDRNQILKAVEQGLEASVPDTAFQTEEEIEKVKVAVTDFVWAVVRPEVSPARACFGCGKDLTEEMAVTIFIREGQNFRPLPDTEVACINCGGNGQNVLTREEYFRITGTEPWSDD